MASIQVGLVANGVALVPLDAPTGRVAITIISGTPAEVYATADGSLPVNPASGVEVPTSQEMMPGVLGASIVLQPPEYGDHMAIATIRLLSAGAPGVLVEW